MKTKAFIMATLVCSSFVFMSCDDDDDKFTPESIVTKAFDTKYPDAQRVSWENEAGYVSGGFTPVHMRLKRGLIRKATGC